MSKASLETLEKKISDEARKVRQAKARLQKLNAARSKLSRQQRTRRLILIGAVMEAKAQKEKEFNASLMKWLDDGISENRNRVLFGLPEKPEGTQNNAGVSKQ